MARAPVYCLTFFTYASVHMMRTTYSFNKPYFAQQYALSNLFLGILDSTIFLTMALGTFLRYSILNDKKHTLTLIKTAIPAAIFYIIVPILSITKANIQGDGMAPIYAIFIIFFGLYGFFQLSLFPATLAIFSQHFNIKNDGILVGAWSSKSNIGDVLGFLLSTILVIILKVTFQVAMFICAGLLILMVILQHIFVPFIQSPEDKITTKQFFQFLRKIWRKTQFKLYILSYSFFQAILYSYEFWTPKFLTVNGYAEYAGYIPMVFALSTFIGSNLMGKLYKLQANAGQDSPIIIHLLQKYKFFASTILIIGVSFCYLFVPGSVAVYFILGALMGLFLGAIYNSLQTSEVLNYTKNQIRKTEMLSTANIAIGATVVGIFQLIIGVVFEIVQEHGQSDIIKKGLVYYVIVGIAVIASILTFIKSVYRKNKDQNDDQLDDLNEKNLSRQPFFQDQSAARQNIVQKQNQMIEIVHNQIENKNTIRVF